MKFFAAVTVCAAVMVGAASDAVAGVAGNSYSGNINFGPDAPGTGPSCIEFSARGTFVFNNNVGSFNGTYTETDLFIFSIWNGTSTAGSAYSGFSLLTFLNFYTITPQSGNAGSAFAFSGANCSNFRVPVQDVVDENGTRAF